GGSWSWPYPSPALQFQGEWFVLGLAGNAFKKEDRALLNPFITTFMLNSKGHLEVSNAMTRGRRCNSWSYVLIPAAQPGRFTVGKGTGVDSEDVQVVDSDYTSYALLLSRRRTGSQTVLRVSLLGRNWKLPPGSLDKFVCLGRAQGLSEDNIVFPDFTDWSLRPGAC
ncbi:PREDICTED: epididymal-specific lipocalin-12, partial [Galeopterus variegatus]|uniref:Epididymal-specific lipocalin-12 n=1 Tax=Galeopterus variegatus TaxID=482537 RepID=A0ABM0R298_GALVR